MILDSPEIIEVGALDEFAGVAVILAVDPATEPQHQRIGQNGRERTAGGAFQLPEDELPARERQRRGRFPQVSLDGRQGELLHLHHGRAGDFPARQHQRTRVLGRCSSLRAGGSSRRSFMRLMNSARNARGSSSMPSMIGMTLLEAMACASVTFLLAAPRGRSDSSESMLTSSPVIHWSRLSPGFHAEAWRTSGSCRFACSRGEVSCGLARSHASLTASTLFPDPAGPVITSRCALRKTSRMLSKFPHRSAERSFSLTSGSPPRETVVIRDRVNRVTLNSTRIAPGSWTWRSLFRSVHCVRRTGERRSTASFRPSCETGMGAFHHFLTVGETSAIIGTTTAPMVASSAVQLVPCSELS